MLKLIVLMHVCSHFDNCLFTCRILGAFNRPPDVSSLDLRFNQVKPKNEVEQRVYEVLSHKNWGASTTLMNEIAQDTFDYEKCECL